ncbi:metal ABC transporter substrate-binding protein [Frankia sp. Cas3]|uniref:metal ABC transporter substrate-binding protein n=1 Tax=Frankia sp. Cas3 TaxID=3073926 RepID=UPI002AD1E729|nr:metal ABC transporter substrate-binding protein [Frankia sp. Cas3]
MALPGFHGTTGRPDRAVAVPGRTTATPTAMAAGKLKVVATTTQVADFARVIGGDRVQVTQILKPNVDPHDYEPSPADVKAIGEANVLVANGVGLEKWLDSAISSANFKGTRVETSAGVKIRGDNGVDEGFSGLDPHIWHNPLNVKIMAANIQAGFTARDPSGADTYEENLAAYTIKLDALDADIARKINSLPPANRKLVTNHDAFGYYVDRYQLTFVGSIIPRFDTSAELSGREAGVKVVAGEDALYGDTFGPQGSAGATYLQMEEHNTKTIVGALM